MGRHGGHAESGADIEACGVWEVDDPFLWQDSVFLRGPCGALVSGEVDPDAVAHGKALDSGADGIDDPGAILVGYTGFAGRRRRGGPACSSFPVRRIDSGDDDLDSDFSGSWGGYLDVDVFENR
ncbi:hypothetical protein GCM10010974_28110 [Brevibacterium sediminis]|uniref:Uncharacterized protein n=1 Tax=Brevibacterium sediminis TaxID=1857024 RepID=A0ABQ1MPS1_9MICO|nr:hypothetical protein GCM10010974_28110 [Brevibacterium sediminis]